MSQPLPTKADTPREELVASFDECWSSMLDVGRGLSEAQWEAPSLCPGWRTKDALIHVTAIEIGFADWGEDRSKPPFPAINAKVAEFDQRPGAEIIEEFARITRRRLDQLATMGDDELDAATWTAEGPGTYRRYMEIRVFDHWVHEQDVRVPLGRPGPLDDDGLAARRSLDEAHLVLGYLVGKRAGAPQGSSVSIHVNGPLARSMHALVDGRARVVPELADSTAEVTVDFHTFMMLCCGRIDPGGPLADGRVQLAGDRELAERVARNLAFTL
jgi:uncharacterized protein (TIGR03083 family)